MTGVASQHDPNPTQLPGRPPNRSGLRSLLDDLLSGYPELTPDLRQKIALAMMELMGDDFDRFRTMYLAASISDPIRLAAFEEYLRRRVAVAGRPLGPDEVLSTISDFERLPAAYVSELAVPVPPPMPGAFLTAPDPSGSQPGRRVKLFPDWADIKRELFKGGAILGVAAMAIMTWQVSKSIEIGGLVLVTCLAFVLYLFRRKGY